MGRKKPLRGWSPFLAVVVRDLITPFRFGDDRLRGFRVGSGSKFTLSHWLLRSSLQHSHTTRWACDYVQCYALHTTNSNTKCGSENPYLENIRGKM